MTPRQPVYQDTVTVQGMDSALDSSALSQHISTDSETSVFLGNAAEALESVTGVEVLRSSGEADRILIRGGESRLVATRLDGETLTSLDGIERSAGLAEIPFDFLELAKVNKVGKPEQDIGGIAGAVDLVTRAPPNDPTTEIRLSGGREPLSDGSSSAISTSIGRRAADGRIGWLLSAANYANDRAAEQLHQRYDALQLQRLDLRFLDWKQKRQGYLLSTDIVPNQQTSFRLRGLSSQTNLHELRTRTKIDLADDEAERELKNSLLKRSLESWSLEEVRQVSDFGFVARVTYQIVSAKEPGRRDTSFILEGLPLAFGDSFGDLARLAASSSTDRYFLDKIGVEDNFLGDETWSGAFDVFRPLRYGKQRSGLWKIGVKIRSKSRRRDTTTRLFRAADLVPLEGLSTSGRHLSSDRYDLGVSVDSEAVANLIEDLGLEGDRSVEEDAGDYTARENTAAAFVQFDLPLSDRATWSAGLRFDRTATEYSGFSVVTGDSLSAELESTGGQRSETALVPSMSLALSLGPQTRLTLSAGRRLARPNYYDLVPFELVDGDDQEIELGNADLRSTVATAFDAAWEWNGSSGQHLALVFFSQQLEDFIYRQRTVAPRMGGLFELNQPLNGPEAHLYGAELAWRSQLGPKPLGLRADLGLSWTSSSTEIPDRFDRPRLPGQAEWSIQSALRWHSGPFALNLRAHYLSDSLIELGASRTEDTFREERLRVHADASYILTERCRLVLQARNLTKASEKIIEANEQHLRFEEVLGQSWSLGLHINF